MHYFLTEMCTPVHISVIKWCIVEYNLVHWGIVKLVNIVIVSLFFSSSSSLLLSYHYHNSSSRYENIIGWRYLRIQQSRRNWCRWWWRWQTINCMVIRWYDLILFDGDSKSYVADKVTYETDNYRVHMRQHFLSNMPYVWVRMSHVFDYL